MGGILGGFFGDSQSTNTTQQVDPTTQAARDLRLNEVLAAQGVLGGLGNLLGSRPDIYNFSPGAQSALSSVYDTSQEPGLGSQDWYSRIISSLSDSLGQNKLNNQSIFNVGSQRLDQRTQANLAANQNLLPYGQNYFEQLVAPTLQNQFALSGLGRSGAIQEALAKAGAQIALPLAQQQSAQDIALRQQGFQGQLGLESLLSGQQSGLGTQYAQNLYGANQQYPNVDIALREAQLGRLQTGFGAADANRQLQERQYQTQLGGYSGALFGLPFTPSVTQTGGTSKPGYLGNLFTGNTFGASSGAFGS